MNSKLFLLVIAVALMMSAGCKSAERLLDEGRYDELLSLARKKMSGKKEKKEKYVVLAEEAFAKITTRDMNRIEALKASNRSGDWIEIVNIAERIAHRQQALEPFLPLVAENGYNAKFTFVRTDDIIQYAEHQVVQTLYDEGLDLIAAGRRGDKVAARNAYERFDDVLHYRSAYQDAYSLREEARDLGIVRVLLQVDNRAYAQMPRYVADAIESGLTARNTFWTQYYFDAAEIRMDYVARFVVNSMEVGPDVIREENITRNRKIQDGWDYVLDARGNVAKDTAGNDIKIARYLEVRAVVSRTHQEKAALLRGKVELQNAENGLVMQSRPVQVESRFYHQAQSFFGDERALEDSDRLHVAMVPFPGDDAMMLDVAEIAQPAFAKELEKMKI